MLTRLFLYAFFILIIVNTVNAADQQNSVSLHYDGVYISQPDHTDGGEDSCEYLRFYSNGTVIAVSSDCDRNSLSELLKWFTFENAGPKYSGVSLGLVSIKGDKISFSAESSEGKVSYQGVIFDDHIDLNTFSFINKSRGHDSYSFLKVEESTITDVDVNSLKQTLKLKGTDFELTTRKVEGSKDQSLMIIMDGKPPITNFTNLDGTKDNLENIRFSAADTFELRKLIPDVKREQLIVKGSASLSRGEGEIKNYSIYSINEGGISKLLNLITERTFEGLNERPPLYMTAKVQEKIENGKIIVMYRYKLDNNHNYRTILFSWNGSAFIDGTGMYKKIYEKYRP